MNGYLIAKCVNGQCSSIEKWIYKLLLINMMEYCSAVRMNELDLHVSTQIGQIVLNENSSRNRNSATYVHLKR